jgi:chorismate synthase
MSLRFLTAGESHGPALLAILEGMPAGLSLSEAVIDAQLARRQRGLGAGPRMKLEMDRVRILSGVMEGKTIGSPIAISIENRDHVRWAGKEIPPLTTPRPGHADLSAAVKYGYDDLRPSLERASARETAARVAVGAVCRQFLEEFGIRLGGYVVSIGKVQADLDGIPLEQRWTLAEQNDVRCPDPKASVAMDQEIRAAMSARDTLGGVIEVVALGVPAGLGSHVQADRRLDARLGAAMLGVPAIKGVEIGEAFSLAHRMGTEAQDAIRLKGTAVTRPTIRDGGTEGGISTGQPLVLRAAMKPIATTLTPQPTVDLAAGKETPSVYERSDFCPVPRAVPILEAVVGIVLAEALLEKLGGDSLDEMKPRLTALRQPRLEDLPMAGRAHKFWPAVDD